MRILVTGANGVVGKILSDVLKKRKHDVFTCDLFHSNGQVGYSQRLSHENSIYSRCDISKYRQIERVIKEHGHFDIIYNCAAEFGRWNGEDYFEQLWDTNVKGLKNILLLQEIYKFKLVHFSTSEVYGDFKDIMKENVMDKFEIKQMNDYALSKWTNEIQIRNHTLINPDNKSVIVRLFNTYGPGENYHPYRSVNSKFCFHALKGLPIEVFKGHYRSSTFISDCVEALANIVDNFIPGRVYNIGSSQFHDIETLAEIIWNYTKAEKNLIKYKDSEKMTTITKKVDNELSKKELNFKETVSLEEGVKITIDWMKNNFK